MNAKTPHFPMHDLPELAKSVNTLYDVGLPRGDKTGWDSVDKLYTVALQQFTLVTGIPGMGKSEWMDALMVNLARNDGWVFAVYSPENYPIESHVAKLVEKYLGWPFGTGPTERMSKADMNKGLLWVLEHFIFLKPQYENPVAILNDAAKFRGAGEGRHKKFGVLLDPWSSLEHLCPAGFTETQYISQVLTQVTNWCRDWDAHVWVVAHPMKIAKDPKTGERPPPTPYDIAGSHHWFGKPDNIITVHRNKDDYHAMVRVMVNKIRFKWIGRLGEALLDYDVITGRYRDAPGPLQPATQAGMERF